MCIYLCTSTPLPPVHVRLEGQFCLQWQATCRRAPRELATQLAVPFLISPFSAVVFFFPQHPPPPSIFHISGSDSHSSKWDLKCLNSSLLRICHIFCQRQRLQQFFPPKRRNRMRSGSPVFFSPPCVSSVRHSNATESQMLQLAHLPPERWKFVAGGVGGKMCSFVTRDVYCIN